MWEGLIPVAKSVPSRVAAVGIPDNGSDEKRFSH
jgi:hypothetical protein